MILRPLSSLHKSFLSVLLVLHAVLVSAQENDFDCLLTLDSLKYDLTLLAGEHTVSRSRDSPPTSWDDTLRFDLCADLQRQDDVPEADQCSPGTRACLTQTNKKTDDSDRVVAVIPVAQSASLNVESSALTSPKGVLLIFHGSTYPSPVAPDAEPIPQSLAVQILCSQETSDPKFLSYDNEQVKIEWNTPAGCGFKGDNPPNEGGGKKEEDKVEESVGSGIGWFFLVLLLAFAAYFGFGAYYNYSTYGATGADLLPHRDFWKEVPYMLRDVVSHLCASVRPRRTSSRGGYIAV